MAMKPCITCGQPSTGSRCPRHTIRNGSTRSWRQLRATILFDDAYTCQICGAGAEDVDHNIPLGDGGTDDPLNLRSLCATCHAQQH